MGYDSTVRVAFGVRVPVREVQLALDLGPLVPQMDGAEGDEGSSHAQVQLPCHQRSRVQGLRPVCLGRVLGRCGQPQGARRGGRDS